MNTKAPRGVWLLILALLVLCVANLAWASGRNQCTGGSNNATWSASGSSSISLAAGSGTGGLGVNMTSPACLNTYPNFPGTLPAYTNVSLDSSTCPDGTSGSGATCTLTAPVASITNNPQSYTAFVETQTYNINFDATNATPGTYTFHVHADASDPNNTHQNGDTLGTYGWGYASGVELTVFVTTQNTCNSSDILDVFFTQPQAGSVNFCNGGTSIPIDVTAGDTNNLITSLTVSVNNTNISGLSVSGLGTTSATATGSYTAGPVGAYLFRASAATACTTGSAGPVEVDLVYVIPDLLPPLGSGAKPKAGNAVPIKFVPTDCGGNPVPYDSSVHIQVYLGSTLLQDSFAGGCTGSSCGSGASSYVQYDSTTGQYSTVFQTGNTTGTTYVVEVWFGGVVNFQTTFTTK